MKKSEKNKTKQQMRNAFDQYTVDLKLAAEAMTKELATMNNLFMDNLMEEGRYHICCKQIKDQFQAEEKQLAFRLAKVLYIIAT